MSVNGFLGGLVAITAPCYWVSPFGAVIIGAVAGIVVPLGIDLLEHLRIDDPIGAVPVHGLRHLGHAWPRAVRHRPVRHPDPDGADNADPVTGLFYGGGTGQLRGPVHRQPHLHRRASGVLALHR